MTVLELVSRWTEEERNEHSDLISECLQREDFLLSLRGRLRAAEAEMDDSLGQLLSRLADLAKIADESKDQVQTLYLRLAKVKGNA